MTHICTRFAPSPTGSLHLGGARTALFNWLFSRNAGGKFFLRIEDTDSERSSTEEIHKILEGLKWLGIDWDEGVIKQSSNIIRHREVAEQLIKTGNAYYCYASKEELESMRTKARSTGSLKVYNGLWRNKNPNNAPNDITPVIRFKAPESGETSINDIVQGKITVNNVQLDDMILLRADGSPTYMLASVVDDHDMGITHIIRGDDHLNNAIRQSNLIQAMQWEKPIYAHIPLIHGNDGAKLSKRHGATGLTKYMENGYLPEAMFNCLLRLGWSHGNSEIISKEEAKIVFSLNKIGKSPAQFDLEKLNFLNGHYIRSLPLEIIKNLSLPIVKKKINKTLTDSQISSFIKLIDQIRKRSTSLEEIANDSLFIFSQGMPDVNNEAKKLLTKDSLLHIEELTLTIESNTKWEISSLNEIVKKFAKDRSLKLVELALPLRAILTGKTTSPGIFEVMYALGANESIKRLKQACKDVKY